MREWLLLVEVEVSGVKRSGAKCKKVIQSPLEWAKSFHMNVALINHHQQTLTEFEILNSVCFAASGAS